MRTTRPTGGPPPPGPGVAEGLSVNLVGSGLVVAVSAAVAGAGVLLALGVAGRPQAVGALFGAGLVAGFYLFGSLTVSLVAAYAPRASLLVALLTYVLQVGALALVLARVQRSGALGVSIDAQWVGGAVVVATVAWLVVLVVRTVRTVPRTSGRSDATSDGRLGG